MSNPILHPAYIVSPAENGYAVYYPGADVLHTLNPTASLLLELCDGTRSIEEIGALVAPILPKDEAGTAAQWIEGALKSGLLVRQGKELEGLRAFTSQELFAIVKQLKNRGLSRAAYLCAQRVVEQEPENWDAWYEYGDLCQYVNKRADARDAYQKYFDHHPEDAEIEHLLVALKDETPPPRASDRAIQQIYKDFAKSYEDRMLQDLGYKGPERLKDSIKAAMGERSGLTVLDLGCGSGLSGTALKPFAAELIGVDLSPEMLELARKRNIYDRLEVGEITAWLANTTQQFDIIASLDCLIYFGDLGPVVSAAEKRLKKGGVLFLSSERGKKYPFAITDNGRYEHHPDHMRDVAKEAGLELAVLNEGFLRKEYGADVIGIFAVMKKA
jgi:predicted TPR repeat methyltransferase